VDLILEYSGSQICDYAALSSIEDLLKFIGAPGEITDDIDGIVAVLTLTLTHSFFVILF
jgi:hypothetical protein